MKSEKKIKLVYYMKKLADTRIFFFSLLWLCFLVIAGTLAQGNMGLYQAQEIYFSSFILWLWWLPLPGGYTTMGIIFLGLTCKLIFITDWKNSRRLGTIIAHFGAWLLLFGGFITAVFSNEGNMVIPEGDTVGYVSDYQSLELAVIDTSHEEYDSVIAWQNGWLKSGKILQSKDIPFKIEITDFCRNCRPIKRSGPADKNMVGLAKRFDVTAIPLAMDVSQNRSAIKFKITQKNKDTNTRTLNYLVLENMRVDQQLLIQNKTYLVKLRKEQRPLPFQIELLDFVKDIHPGTSMARGYSSEVNVIQDGIKQRVLISMNHPLRQAGYTFYQSSFIQSTQDETTVLAVVNNAGRLFPYISSLIMCIGILIHMLIQMPILFKAGRKND